MRSDGQYYAVLSVKRYLRHERTKRHVRLSVVFFRGVHPIGGRSAMLHRNLRREEGVIKIRDQPINTRNLVRRFSGKSLKLMPPAVTFYD